MAVTGPRYALRVDPGPVQDAGDRAARVASVVQLVLDALAGSAPRLRASWQGRSSDAFESEVQGLVQELGASATGLRSAAGRFRSLAADYADALGAVRSLNEGLVWPTAVHASAVATLDADLARQLYRLDHGGALLPHTPRNQLLTGHDRAVAAADARLARVVADADEQFARLRRTLRETTLDAGAGLAGGTLVTVPAHDAALWRQGAGLAALQHGGGGAAWTAFSASLPITSLARASEDLGWNPGLLAEQLAEARALQLPPPDYRDLIARRWQAQAVSNAGIDPLTWDPAAGSDANRATITAVYRYYGDLFLAHPELQWAGMANAIGPSFAGGFFDLATVQGVARGLGGATGAAGPEMDLLAKASADELRFYETTLLTMQKNIFLDQASMHEAYLDTLVQGPGRVNALDEMAAAGLLTSAEGVNVRAAWADVASGDPGRVADGNAWLLLREQSDVIGASYDEMRTHDATGPAFTYLLGAIGAPSIPGARTLGEVDPLTVGVDVDLEVPWAEAVSLPFGPVQNLVSVHVHEDLVTPFPAGNVSDFDERWALITGDTLPAYRALLADDPERARAIAAADVATRVENYRLDHSVGDILGRLSTDWGVRDR